jgi:hypothetical protein
MDLYLDIRPVVQTSASDRAFADIEAKRSDQMEHRPRSGAASCYIARIGRDLRFNKNYMKTHFLFLSYVDNTGYFKSKITVLQVSIMI